MLTDYCLRWYPNSTFSQMRERGRLLLYHSVMLCHAMPCHDAHPGRCRIDISIIIITMTTSKAATQRTWPRSPPHGCFLEIVMRLNKGCAQEHRGVMSRVDLLSCCGATVAQQLVLVGLWGGQMIRRKLARSDRRGAMWLSRCWPVVWWD